MQFPKEVHFLLGAVIQIWGPAGSLPTPGMGCVFEQRTGSFTPPDVCMRSPGEGALYLSTTGIGGC